MRLLYICNYSKICTFLKNILLKTVWYSFLHMLVFSTKYKYYEGLKSKKSANSSKWFMEMVKFTTLQMNTASSLFITVDWQILPIMRHESELSGLFFTRGNFAWSCLVICASEAHGTVYFPCGFHFPCIIWSPLYLFLSGFI